jgi:hypothetical protein
MENLNEKVVIFNNYANIEPQELIRLNLEYNNCIPELKDLLRKNKDKNLELPFVRIKPNGFILYKKIFGTIGELKENQFQFTSNKDIDGNQYEEKRIFTIRLDNVLGTIPLLPSMSNINPFENNSSEKTKEYFDVLLEMKELMKNYSGLQHAAILFYRYDKKNYLFRNGNYKVECKITQVNNSNIEYEHYRTFSFISKDESYVDYVPRTGDIDRFIAPDRYLWKVEIDPNREHNINPYDES